MNWLIDFLEQAQTTNLKTSHFPKEYGDFKMKVSFGQGMQARVPWISFIANGMSTSNGYYPVYLYYRESKKLILSFGVSETTQSIDTWKSETIGESLQIKELIDAPARYGDSWVFKAYEIVIDEQGIQLASDGQSLSSSELETDLNDLFRLYVANLDESIQVKDSPLSAGLFYLEKQLEDFLVENWDNIDLGTKYELLYEEGLLVSQQYKTAIGPIDILAKNKNTGNYVVIELKRNQTSDDTAGQVLRYMGWVAENLNNSKVEGLIIAGKYDEKLRYATEMLPSVDVYLYSVSFNLVEHKRA